MKGNKNSDKLFLTRKEFIQKYTKILDNKMNLKIKQFDKDRAFKLPQKANNDQGNGAFDLFASHWEEEINGDNQYKKVTYYFNIASEFPSNYVALIFPRSSIHKTDLRLSNCVGIIDSNYRGEWRAVFDRIDQFKGNLSATNANIIPLNQAVAQVLFIKLDEVDIELVYELSTTERGEGGFGSTNK